MESPAGGHSSVATLQCGGAAPLFGEQLEVPAGIMIRELGGLSLVKCYLYEILSLGPAGCQGKL